MTVVVSVVVVGVTDVIIDAELELVTVVDVVMAGEDIVVLAGPVQADSNNNILRQNINNLDFFNIVESLRHIYI